MQGRCPSKLIGIGYYPWMSRNYRGVHSSNYIIGIAWCATVWGLQGFEGSPWSCQLTFDGVLPLTLVYYMFIHCQIFHTRIGASSEPGHCCGAQAAPGVAPDAGSFQLLVAVLERAGDWQQALVVHEVMNARVLCSLPLHPYRILLCLKILGNQP